MNEINKTLILLSKLNRQVAVNSDDDGRADKKLQQVIKGKEDLDEHDNEGHTLLHSCNTNRNIFKKVLDSILTVMMTPYSRTKVHGGVKSKEGIRVTLKNKHNLVYYVFTHKSSNNEDLLPIHDRRFKDFRYTQSVVLSPKKKRLPPKNHSETKQSSVPTMRFDTGRIAIWSTATHSIYPVRCGD